jgi:predicted RNA-binding protein with TRAM domain
LSAFTGLGAAALATSAPAFAAGAPTVADGYGAYGNSPVVTLTGCTGAASQATLTCTTNPITAGVTVGMGAYGPSIASTTPNTVSSVTATTVVLSANVSAAVTATQTESFSGTQGIGNAVDATPTTTVTSAANFADYGVVAGIEVYGPGIAPQTTVASVSGTTMVLSQVPTAPLSAATLYFNAPDVNNVMTQVTGGASNVNTSSLTVVSQPPAADGYVTTSTTATTGIVNMYQALNPADNAFTATLAYCAPTFTYPSAGNCTTFTEHYAITQSQDMGEQLVEIIATENIYEGADQAHFGPTTAAQGQTVTLTEAPPGGSVPTTNSGATVNYIDGDTYIMPVPAGLTYVPGTAHTIGGDAQTSAAGATTATYCTAAGPGCTACNFSSGGCTSKAPNGNASYPTTYPYLEEQYGTATANQAKGGALHQLPAIQAQFVASGSPGSVQNQYITEYLVNTNVTEILTIAVAFDGYPTSGSNGSVVPPVAPPTSQAALVITPSVTATSTSNGSDNGADTGGQTVQITGTGFTSAGGEQVNFGANPATSFTVNSNTSITAVAPASTTGDGPVDVMVTNGGQTSPVNAPADQFTYIAPGAPDFPLSVSPTSDNGQAEVSWTPGFSEGSPTQSYTVTATDVSSPSNDPNNGGQGLETCTFTVPGTDGPTDSCTVPGLTNGDNYTFQVTATNALGTGVPSAATTAIAIGAPTAPTGVSATGAQNAQSTVSWTDPANTGADPLLSDTATATDTSNSSSPTNGSTCTYFEAASPNYDSGAPVDQCTVSGLTNGDTYTFAVTSTSGAGTGVASSPSASVVPSTVPGAPTIGTATSNANGQSVVSFTAPASNGGAAISSYTVSASDTTNPGTPITASGAASPITVTGLSNGDTYSFTVTATNVSGTGPASGSTTATPTGVPGAPTNVTAVVGGSTGTGTAAVSWTAPASNGGAGISKYTVTSSTGSKTCSTTATPPAVPATTCNVTALTNGTNYTFTVVATNASGNSAASVAGPVGGVVPSTTPATPSAPTVVVAGLNGQATVTWTAPNNNGSTITGYTLNPTPACPGCTGLTAAASPTTVSGLTNGTSYTFTLVATNANGNSAASSASTAAVVGIPATPTAPATTSTSTAGQDSVSWTAPASASGPITGYTLTPNPACATCTGLTVTGSPAATSTTVGGLTAGTSYTFTLKATNASGTSAASTASAGVVTGSPTAPTNVVAQGGTPAASGALIVTWSAPASSGVGTINSYTATSSTGSKTCTSTSTAPATPALTCTITGLTNGTSYTVSVTATNSAGTAYKSVASAASPAAFPSTTFAAPTIGTATYAGNQSATVKWTAPAALAGTQPPLTGYVVTPFIGTTAQTAQTFNSTATTETVTGLAPGSTYSFSVQAINANGAGTASAKSATVTVTGSPVFTSDPSTTFTENTAGTFSVTATGNSAITFSETGSLPSGVTLGPDGTLAGTPAFGTAGSYAITVTATDTSSNTSTQAFTLTVTGVAPVFTSDPATSFAEGTAGTFAVTAAGDAPISFTETGSLPSGVSLGTDGTLAGTPDFATAGSYPITITATDANSNTATQAFTLTVTGTGPSITSGASTTFAEGSAGTFSVTATGDTPITFTETGALPSGVTLGADGTLAGTPGLGSAGSYPITITATDANTATTTQAFTLTVTATGPVFTSDAATSFAENTAGTFAVAATGDAPISFSETGSLPSGVSLGTDGTLAGTPAFATAGSYPFTITATDANSNTTTQAFTLTVTATAPVFTSSASISFAEGTAGTFSVTANGDTPIGFTETGDLPSGVSLGTDGTLAGTPDAGTSGSYPITITATDANANTSIQAFTLTVAASVPVFTSAATTTFAENTAGTFPVTATGDTPITYTKTGALPTGVTLATDGTLAGTPAFGTAGSYPLTITATDANTATTTQAFTLTVSASGPVFTSAATATFAEGSAGTFSVTANGDAPIAFTESGLLPSGVGLATNGTLSGTPAAGSAGSYPITITATDANTATTTQAFTLTVSASGPVFTSAATATFAENSAGTFPVTATGDTPIGFTESGTLPSGVGLAANGTLAGTPAFGTAGSYPIIITATDANSNTATQSFTLTVSATGPTFTSGTSTTFTETTGGTFNVTATGDAPITYTKTGTLPSGVTLASNGTLAGTPAFGTAGSYPITITATDANTATKTQAFTLTVTATGPSITSATVATFTANTANTFTVTATGDTPITFTETGPLPTGVSLATNGTLAGTPAAGTQGSYPLTLTATDVHSGTATQAFTLTVSNNPPTTAVIVPSNNATVTGTTTLDALATAQQSGATITKDQFVLTGGTFNKTVLGTGTGSLYGYVYSWNTVGVPNGAYTLQSLATDSAGNTAYSAGITITVSNNPPTTSVIVPSNGATVSGTSTALDAVATAQQSGTTISKVQFVLTGGTFNKTVVGTGTASIYGYVYSWNTIGVPNGAYTLQSLATDSAGNTAYSAGITITVSNNPPTTSVIVPSNNATVSGTTALDALATAQQSGATISKVQFVLTGGTYNKTVLGTASATIYGYVYSWSTVGVPNGTYTLQSLATDSVGNTTYSAGITVKVSN